MLLASWACQVIGRYQIFSPLQISGSIFTGRVWCLLVLVFCCLGVSREGRSESAAGWELLRDGDLVFRAGRGLFSTLFSNIGEQPTPYSHVGIIHRSGNLLYVIHAEADDFTGVGFVRMDPLVEFVSPDNASAYTFKRVVSLTGKLQSKVLLSALAYVQRQVPFDTAFDLTSDDRLYCSELVYKAFLSAGIELVDHPEVIRLPAQAAQRSAKVITIGQLVHSGAVADIGQLVQSNH